MVQGSGPPKLPELILFSSGVQFVHVDGLPVRVPLSYRQSFEEGTMNAGY